ncbi:DUF4282 domain-containing protein [Actinoallomurus purpureus]|uniref:DUF4282 domain-containing protein n=1 Tax=Actinoallomurus purpureus TaxID=478114 RepID=UPI0020926267|nr:DUF4282 domain-containing protein [Actinoallomurus purpureus]MCO6006611.1 DUF4282 domain-containing protein [Actinoallomurus purpureus]
MSNAPDDPGHRPPPPRQGDPQPYQGDPQPYRDDSQPYQGDPGPYQGGQPPYSGYPPPPNQPPPPASPWQGPPPGYGPPPHAPQGSPGYPPRPAGKGFFGAIFDMNFDHMITVKLARVIYVVFLLLISFFSLIILWYGYSIFQWNALLGLMVSFAAPLTWIFYVLVLRVSMEFVINQFKITEHLKAIRERGDLR